MRKAELQLILIVCTIVSSVFCCCRTSNNEPQQQFENKVDIDISHVKEDEKTWLFSVDGRKAPYSFLDPTGKLVGFDVDLIAEVCSIAKKQCKMVLTEFQECSLTNRNINYAGRGLMSGSFDVCPGYARTLDREAAFDFSTPYLQTTCSFTVLPGNPSGFNPNLTDYSQFTLMHLTGAPSNAKCLGRLRKTFNNIIIANDLPDAKNKLEKREADVLFSPRNVIADLEVLPERVRCDDGGVSMMTKKGSDFNDWWNPAFQSFVRSTNFSQFCSREEVVYNRTFKCLLGHGKPSSPHKTDKSLKFKPRQDEKTWLFAVSGRRKPFNYLDDVGNLVGFDVDFITDLCSFAGQECAVVLSPFTECGYTHRNINYPGRGLMENWFDACTGYANSLDRDNSFDFTDAYLLSDATFSVMPGNPFGFNPDLSDFTRFTFTHLTGAYTNAQCLNRLKKKIGNIVVAANLPEAKELLFNGTASVLFSPREKIPDLETLPARVHCEKEGSGTSMMTKKGSGLPTWWNKAFTKYVNKGLFAKLCSASVTKYRFPIKCKIPAQPSIFMKRIFAGVNY